MNELETKIDGIPCRVRYTLIGEHYPATRTTPEEWPEIMMTVLDLNGRPAKWLESKMTDQDVRQIFDVIYDQEYGQ